MGWLSSIISLIANALGLAKTVQEERNTPEMQANKTARQDAKTADAVNTEVDKASKGDAKAQQDVEKGWAE